MLQRETSGSLTSRIGLWLSRRALKKVGRILDYAEYGGALLLGIRGVGVICHGSSSPKAIKNAVRTARNFVNSRVQERLEKGLAVF
jgi:glycerol-3-phosphate acyltransferase PlsX